MKEEKTNETIDLGRMFHKLWARKKTFLKVWVITFIVASAYIVSLPRYYTSEIKLAPEIDNGMSEGSLGSLASSFGIDLGTMATSDAISPELYPELLGTNDFISLLFPMTVETQDKTLKTSYYNYLDKHQKSAWWGGIIEGIKSIFPKDDDTGGSSDSIVNPLNLSKRQSKIADFIKDRIGCAIDRKTSLITITVTDQDPRICATIADSIRIKLQDFIIEYRTRKARIDVDYYRQLVAESKQEYDQARIRFADYSDSHAYSVLENVNSKKTDLENDMQLKYSNYTAYNTQLQASMAKLQQRTPSFTLLQGASIPVKPAGPKRMIFVAVMLILASLVTAGRIIMKDDKTKE
ncbi:MAG: chain-length determining protein [Prevotella sp.]|nr:chain-length determining protein [Prevotella sp.]